MEIIIFEDTTGSQKHYCGVESDFSQFIHYFMCIVEHPDFNNSIELLLELKMLHGDPRGKKKTAMVKRKRVAFLKVSEVSWLK